MGANPIATAPAASKRNERVIVPYRSCPGAIAKRELEDAPKQLQLEETAQSVTIRLEGDVLFDSP